MAANYVTVDGACKGKAEDIALMKQRLAALMDNQDKLDDPDWLRELFGEEIDDLVDLDDEDAVSETFGGFHIEWSGNRSGEGYADTYDLQFGGDPAKKLNHSGGTEVYVFLEAIQNVFRPVEFHFITWCYNSSGCYRIFREGEEDEEDYDWAETDDGEEKKDAYVAWRLAYRAYWLLDEAAPTEERAAAKAAEEDAEKAFNLLLSSGDEDEEEEKSSEDNDEDEDSGFPEGLFQRAKGFRDEGRYEEALKLHDKAIRLRPDEAAYWSGRGWTYYLKGDYEKALADMDEALRLEPDDEYRQERRLQIADKLEEQGKQAADFNYSLTTLLRTGLDYHSDGEFEKSLKAYGKALQQLGNDPAATDFYNSRAYTYKDMGRLDEAIADLTKALELKPDGLAGGGVVISTTAAPKCTRPPGNTTRLLPMPGKPWKLSRMRRPQNKYLSGAKPR